MRIVTQNTGRTCARKPSKSMESASISLAGTKRSLTFLALGMRVQIRTCVNDFFLANSSTCNLLQRTKMKLSTPFQASSIFCTPAEIPAPKKPWQWPGFQLSPGKETQKNPQALIPLHISCQSSNFSHKSRWRSLTVRCDFLKGSYSCSVSLCGIVYQNAAVLRRIRHVVAR